MDTGTRTVSSYVFGFCLSHYEYFHYSKQKKKKEVYWTRYTMYHMYDDQISLCIIIFQNTVHGVHRKELSRHIMTEKKKKKEREQFQSDDI